MSADETSATPSQHGAPTSRWAASRREQAEIIASVRDPFARRSLRAAYHFRRYGVIYAVLTLGALTLGLLPTIGSASNDIANGAGASTGGAYGGQSGPGSVTGGSKVPGKTGAGKMSGLRTTGGASSGTTAGGAAGPTTSTSGGPVGSVHVASGVTRGGYRCRSGVHQLPYSQYAAPCVSKFTGNNGGATWNGVTGTTITIAMRHTKDASGANAKAVEAEAEAAGGVSPEVEQRYVRRLVDYFNKTFELYGRRVRIVDFDGVGDGQQEQLGHDQAGACADADTAANEVHAFADLRYFGLYEYPPFAACAPRYHLVVPFGALYYPESDYQKWNPYVWSITTSCTMGGTELAEFLGKQIAPYPAKYAGNDGALNMKGRQRKFAIYVPSNAGYQECAANTKRIMQTKYHVASNRFDQYNYALDISQAGTDSNKAAIQFSANQDTSVILSTDPIAPTFLTQACHNQNYFPEWIITGVALTDQDNWAQLWDQSELRGRTFGLSQLGSTDAMLNPHGEAAKSLKAAGIPLNPGSALIYYEMVPIFNQLQAAGPILTPANIAAGTRELPVLGGATGADGTWDYGSTHTGIVDSREIYWNADKTSPANGKKGTYIVIYGGRRFRIGQYPTGEPPFYP